MSLESSPRDVIERLKTYSRMQLSFPPPNEYGRSMLTQNTRGSYQPTEFKIMDVRGGIGKCVPGKVYYVMKSTENRIKNAKTWQIVDSENPNLKDWSNISKERFYKYICDGGIKYV